MRFIRTPRPGSAPHDSSQGNGRHPTYRGRLGRLLARTPAPPAVAPEHPPEAMVDLERRRSELRARVAELQWDLGGLAYEMAIRNHVKVDLLVKRAALLQDAEAELAEVERILRLEHTGEAGLCPSCGAPHSTGAVYCWQCGRNLLEQVPSQAITSS